MGTIPPVRSTETAVKYTLLVKGKIGRLGVHIVHLGVLIIIAGGILGGLFGYSGNIGILEGDTDDAIVLKDNRTVKLPFKIKLENFELSYYDNSTKPKQYTSDIVISDQGPENISRWVSITLQYIMAGHI